MGSLLPWNAQRKGENLVERDETAEAVLAELDLQRTQIKNGAFYNPAIDVINIPPEQSFIHFTGETATQSYYATLFHEVAHWTGHRHRLARTSIFDLFSQTAYAREELVAEATAMLLLRHFGLAPQDISRHASYFQGWLKAAGDVDEALAYAKEEAARAARFILGVNTT